MHIKNTATTTTIAESSVIAYALLTFCFEMLLLNAPTARFENILRTACARVKNVLVLIPPPVDPGEAPINIRTQRTKSPAVLKLPIGYVEKPAVLAETL